MTPRDAPGAPGVPYAPGTPDAPGPVGPFELVWEDRFEGPAGTLPDPAHWCPDLLAPGAKNGELQRYTADPRNIALDGEGRLVLTARREADGGFTSGCVYSARRIHARYGRIEVRAKVPAGQGLWPAFWMMGEGFLQGTHWPHNGEIDVMEILGHRPDELHNTLHGPGYSGADSLHSVYRASADGAPTDLSQDFHTYGVDWAPGEIRWWLDAPENVTGTRTAAELTGELGVPWIFDQPCFLILNLAVGGDWPGAPDEATAFPAQMLVDHVRIQQGRDGHLERAGALAADSVAPHGEGPGLEIAVSPQVRRGDAGTVTVHADEPEGRDGAGVLLLVDGAPYEAELVEGRAELSLPPLPPGTHELRAVLSDPALALSAREAVISVDVL